MVEFLLAIGGALIGGGGVIGYLQLKPVNRKTNAEAHKTGVEADQMIIQNLLGEVDRLKNTNEALVADVKMLYQEIESLKERLEGCETERVEFKRRLAAVENNGKRGSKR